MTCLVDGCDARAWGKGFCEFHYRRFRRHGDPLKGGKRRPPNGAASAWLHALAATPPATDACIEWPYARDASGYGRVLFRGRILHATRAICLLTIGDPPTARHHAAHSCGNGHLGCVHPRHLRWATPKENSADRQIHGTGNGPVGELNARAKLTMQQVIDIRHQRSTNGVSTRVLAAKYGVAISTVNQVLNGRHWNKISRPEGDGPNQLSSRGR